MGQILDLIDHHVVDFGACVASEPDEVENVVDCVHDIIASSFELPSFVLAEGLIDVLLLISAQENVRGFFQVDLFGNVLAWVEVGAGSSLDAGENLGPDKMRSDVLVGVVHFLDIGPEIGRKIVVVHFEREFAGLFVLQFFSQGLLILVFPKLNLPHVLVLQLLLIRVVDFFFHILHDIVFVVAVVVIVVFLVEVLDHHDSFLLVVPGGLGVLLNQLFVFVSDEEGLFQGAVDHHDVALDGEEARVV